MRIPERMETYMVKENCTSENLISKNVFATIHTAATIAVYAMIFDRVLPSKKGESNVRFAEWCLKLSSFNIKKPPDMERSAKLSALRVLSGRAMAPQENPFVCEQRPVSQHLTRRWLLFVFFIIRLFFRKCNCFCILFCKRAQTFDMLLIVIRTAIVFLLLLVVIRAMGKRQIGEMQPFELVITLVVADLACIPMADTSIPLLYGAVAVLTIFALHEIITLVDLKMKRLKPFISGKPSLVVNKNGIDEFQLKKNNLDIADLIESLRVAGYSSLDCIDYALYESNGMFSALPKQGFSEMNTSLPLVIINNGEYDTNNLSLTGLSRSFFDGILKGKGVSSYKRVLVLTADGEGKIYLQEKGKKYRTFTVPLPHGIAW